MEFLRDLADKLVGLPYIRFVTRVMFLRGLRGRAGRLARLSLAMNIMRFAKRRGIRDRLVAYRASKTKTNWNRVIERAEVNDKKAHALYAALAAIRQDPEFGDNPDVASLIDEVVPEKMDLYRNIIGFKMSPPRNNDKLDEWIGIANELDQRRAEVDTMQKKVVNQVTEFKKQLRADRTQLVKNK